MSIEVKRWNKRVESVSGALMNLGTALFAATAVRLFDRGSFDGSSTLWLAGCIVLIWVSLKALDVVEEET